MSKLNDNEVKEVARMQQLIDFYENAFIALSEKIDGIDTKVIKLVEIPIEEQVLSVIGFVFTRTQTIWHSGNEIPKTGKIVYVSEVEGINDKVCTGFYSEEKDDFEPYDEIYYSGNWKDVHINKWAYLIDLVPKE